MSKLTDKQVEEWMAKLQEGVFFLVGTEIQLNRTNTFVNILKHFDGKVEKLPKIEVGLKRFGYCAPRIITQELLKTQGDIVLKGAPDDVIDAIIDENSKLCKDIKNLFVDAYYKCEYKRILEGVTHWDTFKSITESLPKFSNDAS